MKRDDFPEWAEFDRVPFTAEFPRALAALLSDPAYKLLGVLVSYQLKSKALVFPSQATLREECGGWGLAKLKRALAELVAKGCVRPRQRATKTGGFSTNDYELHPALLVQARGSRTSHGRGSRTSHGPWLTDEPQKRESSTRGVRREKFEEGPGSSVEDLPGAAVAADEAERLRIAAIADNEKQTQTRLVEDQ